jgi:hypothetical protein
MVSTSNDGIMSEYLIKYGIVKASERERPTNLLETLYMAEHYQAGDDLKSARANYDHSVWTDRFPEEFRMPAGVRKSWKPEPAGPKRFAMGFSVLSRFR